MKIVDIIFALVSGELVGLAASDFLKGFGFSAGYWYLLVWLLFPLLALFYLWIASVIGKRFLFVFQAAKHILVGALATIIDLKLFEFLFWILSFLFYVNALIIKAISFLVATILKYLGNKYWTFQKYEKHDLHKEIFKLIIVDVVGLIINVGAFYYFTKIMGPQFNVSTTLWLKVSVIFAALVSAVCNFLGYKFLVFKK